MIVLYCQIVLRSKENICVRKIELVTCPRKTARKTVRFDATIPQVVMPGNSGHTIGAICIPRHFALGLIMMSYGGQESVKNMCQVKYNNFL